MAFATTTYLALAFIGATAGAAYSTEQGRKKNLAFQRQSAAEQMKAQAEEKALNAKRAAEERRTQIREARISTAKLLQSSENTGTTGGSGQLGAVAGMATQLGANIGTNLGYLQGANAISGYNQAAANYQFLGQQALSDAQGQANMWNLAGSTAASAFGGGKR